MELVRERNSEFAPGFPGQQCLRNATIFRDIELSGTWVRVEKEGTARVLTTSSVCEDLALPCMNPTESRPMPVIWSCCVHEHGASRQFLHDPGLAKSRRQWASCLRSRKNFRPS